MSSYSVKFTPEQVACEPAHFSFSRGGGGGGGGGGRENKAGKRVFLPQKNEPARRLQNK